MTVRYVGIGGNDANSGLTWALRKLTLNGAEDTPVVAGDTVYVGPGTYRELLTVDVSATVGNPVTYIGDYLGTNTDGVGGVVRITGSDNDQTGTRAQCINAAAQRNYRTWRGFAMDTSTGAEINNVGGTNWIIEQCIFAPQSSSNNIILFSGATQANCTVQNCYFNAFVNARNISVTHTVTLDNVGHIIQNCIFAGGTFGVATDRVGGITVKNCSFYNMVTNAVRIATAITVGQVVTVNNCIIQCCTTGVQATVTGEIVEDYNTFFACAVNRTNVAVGTNSLTYPALFDTRWFFQLINAGAGPSDVEQVISPFDLSSLSQLLNVAGTSPTTTDMRGTAVQGAQREWGALEYDSTLKIAGSAASGGSSNLLVGKL